MLAKIQVFSFHCQSDRGCYHARQLVCIHKYIRLFLYANNIYHYNLHPYNTLTGQLVVPHRGLYVPLPRQHMNHARTDAIHQPLGSKTIQQCMNSSLFAQACLLAQQQHQQV